MNQPRLMIAALQSGSGKTLVTCALLQALVNLGKRPSSFKCGPDYIDPMFHKKVLGVPSGNLDSYFNDASTLETIFVKESKDSDISIIEGVMGLYDGLAGTKTTASCYEIAKITKTPIILVVDAHSLARTIVPILAGMKQYDTEHLIQGVILNRISSMFYPSLKRCIEEELQMKVVGYLPKLQENVFTSRHLGLVMPDEVPEVKRKLQDAANQLAQTVSMTELIEIANGTGGLNPQETQLVKGNDSENVRIGIAKDEAFCFYYRENLELLEELGVTLCPFSPIKDEKLPEKIHGMILGGGYPELYLKELSSNTLMLESVRTALENGMPSLAECGGFLYLHEQMEDVEGTAYPLVGIIPGKATYQGRLVRFGYHEFEALQEGALLKMGETIRGHEFHYYDSENNGQDFRATKPVSGRNFTCIHANENHIWGFAHLNYLSNPAVAMRFVQAAREYDKQV